MQGHQSTGHGTNAVGGVNSSGPQHCAKSNLKFNDTENYCSSRLQIDGNSKKRYGFHLWCLCFCVCRYELVYKMLGEYI